jgi:hypothetical protein
MTDTKNTCGCCKDVELATPRLTFNRPGLDALTYRAGEHASFMETMKTRLSGNEYPALRGLRTRAENDASIALLDAWATVADVLTFYQERIANEGYLRTATQRRSILELARLVGYALRPGVAASVWLALELDTGCNHVIIRPNAIKAQSVPGPGELPQTFENIEPLEARHEWNRLQPRLSQPQTIGTIRQDSQTGSTPSEPGWRIYLKGIGTNLKINDVMLIYDDINLTAASSASEKTPSSDDLYQVIEVIPDPEKDRTLVKLKPMTAPSPLPLPAEEDEESESGNSEMSPPDLSGARAKAAAFARAMAPAVSLKNGSKKAMAQTALIDTASSASQGSSDPLVQAVVGLVKPGSVPPRNTASLDREIKAAFAENTDIGLQVAGALQADLKQSLPTALAGAEVALKSTVKAYVFRVVAKPFGYNAPLKMSISESVRCDEWTNKDMEAYETIDKSPTTNSGEGPSISSSSTLYLDASYDKIMAGSWAVVDTGGVVQSNEAKLDTRGVVQEKKAAFNPSCSTPILTNVTNLQRISRAAYGITGPSTLMKIGSPWFSGTPNSSVAESESFKLIRQTVIYVQSEELTLADEPIEESITGGVESDIELDRLYSGLQSGRWLIVAGERNDIKDIKDKNDTNGSPIRGIQAAELVMLAEVSQKARELSGDHPHTFIKLAKKLEYSYRRDTVTIYANVVKATHGETRKETLGSGNAALAFPSFTLKQPPLAFMAAPTPAGAESTLKVYVNDVQWHETDSLTEMTPNDRVFITKTGDEGKTSVIFGDGHHGAPLPSGTENIRAIYRNGIGKVGNVLAGQISQLMSRPLGLKGVINPLRASGGADRENGDTARKNAPRTVTALDRLISVSDYADFTRTFAGIGKALAKKISDEKREWVHVTIAGAGDIPIAESSDLYRNLRQALYEYGDPQIPVIVQMRELLLMVVSANVCISPDYQWETVAAALRARMLDVFSFERRELGQDVLLSEVIATMQSVRGVLYVDVDVLGGIPEKKSDEDKGECEDDGEDPPSRRPLTPKEIADEANNFFPETNPEQPKQRLSVNLAGFDENKNTLHPAQLAYLTSDVADTLIINRVVK